MKAIKEIKKVEICNWSVSGVYSWQVDYKDYTIDSKNFTDKEKCKNHFKRFAEANGITNYKFKEK